MNRNDTFKVTSENTVAPIGIGQLNVLLVQSQTLKPIFYPLLLPRIIMRIYRVFLNLPMRFIPP